MGASPKSPSDVVSETLRGSSVHDLWERRYRSHGGDRYRIRLFDFVAAQLGDPTGGVVLDAGCGPAVHAVRLAERGFTVLGIDSSPAALRLARANVERAGYSDSISLRDGDLLRLPMPDHSHKRVMCWGVLMHVPEVERAIAELVRVTAAGGTIVISESNLLSLHGRLIRPVLARRSRTVRMSREAPGLEIWRRTAEGDLFNRVADPHWLTAAFARHGATLLERRPSALTDIYTRLPGHLSSAVRLVNHAFYLTRWPGPALTNVFVFRKNGR
jgi:SAM-dependent methyltransferase